MSDENRDSSNVELIKTLIAVLPPTRLAEIRSYVLNISEESFNDIAEAHSVGDHVSFYDRKGKLLTGTIVKINRKSMKVYEPGSGLTWTVPIVCAHVT
jgi:hypothetical protein